MFRIALHGLAYSLAVLDIQFSASGDLKNPRPDDVKAALRVEGAEYSIDGVSIDVDMSEDSANGLADVIVMAVAESSPARETPEPFEAGPSAKEADRAAHAAWLAEQRARMAAKRSESSPAESSPAESSPAESSPAESSPAESSPGLGGSLAADPSATARFWSTFDMNGPEAVPAKK